jgi:hypothetical protein
VRTLCTRRPATLGQDAPADCERALAQGGRDYLRLFERCDVVLSPTLARAALITAFWSYQLPGLNGLMAFIDSDLRSDASP